MSMTTGCSCLSNVRTLDYSEWGKLRDGALTTLLQYVDPMDVAVVAVEQGKKIVASVSVVRVVHLEGIWIDPEHRNAGVTRSLMNKAVECAQGWTGAGWVIGGAADDRMRDILTRLGGVKIPMESYALSLGRE